MAKKKTREVCGIIITQEEEGWAWSLAGQEWRYLAFRLYKVAGSREVCAGFFAAVEGAVGYSMGYVDGWREGAIAGPPPLPA